MFLIAALLVITVVIGWRLAFDWTSRRVGPRERLLLVGTSAAAITLARELYERRHELGVEIVGFADPNPELLGTSVINPGVIGTIDQIPEIVRSREVDRVVVSLADARGKLPMDKLLEMKLDGVSFDHLASVYEEYTGKIAVENLRPSWLIFSSGFRKSAVLASLKRTVDVVLSLGGPGRWRRRSSCWLRWPCGSLHPVRFSTISGGSASKAASSWSTSSAACGSDAEATTGPVWASKTGDPRVTPIGTVAAAAPVRRAAPALERPPRRDEPRRSAAGAARVRRRVDARDSVLRTAPRRPSRA